MAVAAMVRQNEIGLAQIAADTSADGFLANILMDGAVDEASIEGDLGGFLEGADQRHRLVEFEDVRRFIGSCFGGHGFPVVVPVVSR
jgi:hypothetical protein